MTNSFLPISKPLKYILSPHTLITLFEPHGISSGFRNNGMVYSWIENAVSANICIKISKYWRVVNNTVNPKCDYYYTANSLRAELAKSALAKLSISTGFF